MLANFEWQIVTQANYTLLYVIDDADRAFSKLNMAYSILFKVPKLLLEENTKTNVFLNSYPIKNIPLLP